MTKIELSLHELEFSRAEANDLCEIIHHPLHLMHLALHNPEWCPQILRNHPLAFDKLRHIRDRPQGVPQLGGYGFPESHAASFALLVYASSWIKRHHPAEFLAAMLNSQPLGFYSPSQLVQDARRHDVEVRPVDVMHSDYDCTLEGLPHPPAVRLGMRLISGLKEASAQRIVAARRTGPFDSAEDLARRAELEQHEMRLLAGADVLLVRRIGQYVESRLADPDLSVEQLCTAFGLSRSSLYRLLEPRGGVAAFVRERRLSKAHQLLAGAQERVHLKRVADDFGFRSAAQFSRAFHDQFGYKPSEARLWIAPLADSSGPLQSEARCFANWLYSLHH